MAVTMAEAIEMAINIAKAKYPILLRGSHGIGKSNLSYFLGNHFGLEVVEKRLSQMSEGDFLGIPFKHEDGYTKTLPMYWLWKASREPVILFLDEIDRADRQLRQAAFQLMDSRMVDGVSIHSGTIIIGAINGGIHGKHYMVQPMDPAELSRYSVIDLEPTQNEWLVWARQEKIHKNILEFIKSNPSCLEHDGEFEPDKVYPCRRSWVRFSDVLIKNKIDLAGGPSIAYNIGKSFVGVEAATAFIGFIRKKHFNISVDALLKGKLKKHYGKLTHNQINEVFLKLENCKQLKRSLTKSELKNLAKFFISCPDEFLRKMMSVVSNSFNQTNIEETNINRLLETNVHVDNNNFSQTFQEWWGNKIEKKA